VRCVSCGEKQDKVIDSRTSKDGKTIRRRRECLSCEHRCTTYESSEALAADQTNLKAQIAGAYDELGELLKQVRLG